MLKSRVLLIDDSDEIHEIVKRTIGDICDIDSSFSFSEGIVKFDKNDYSIVIIDLNLEDKKNGMDLLKEFKSHPTESRFFIMTGKDSENDELLGHSYGVDEYIKKPVNREILRAIIIKNLRILKHQTASEISISPFYILPDEFRASVIDETGNKEELQLTSKEFKILVKLVSNPDKPFSREDLFNQIWESESESTFRTIDMHVSSLRKKLGKHGDLIRTVHQVGYKFSP